MTEEQKRNHVRALNLLHRRLSKDKRDKIIADMLMDGMSTREVSAATGVPRSTVHDSGVRNRTPERKPQKVTGKDGKQYPAKQTPRQKPVPYRSRKHLARRSSRPFDAAQRMETATTDRMLTTNRAARISREVQAQERAATVTGDVKISG